MNMMHGMHYEKGELVPNTMNPVRERILKEMSQAYKQGNTGDVLRLNQKFMERSRGKGRN